MLNRPTYRFQSFELCIPEWSQIFQALNAIRRIITAKYWMFCQWGSDSWTAIVWMGMASVRTMPTSILFWRCSHLSFSGNWVYAVVLRVRVLGFLSAAAEVTWNGLIPIRLFDSLRPGWFFQDYVCWRHLKTKQAVSAAAAGCGCSAAR